MQRLAAARSALVGIILMLSLAACARSDSGASGAPTVTDSAGIRVVGHAAGPFVDTVPLEPLQSIGREGDPDYEFFSVRAVTPLASGNVVVANGGTSELLFFDPEGRYLRRVGRPGEGPAEFGFLTTVLAGAGDTLAVMDPRRRRLVYFDSAGTFVRGEPFNDDLTAAPPAGTCVFPGLMGLLADGTRFTRGWACMELEGVDGVRPMMVTLELARGERRDTLARIVMSQSWERADAQGPESFEMIPFAPILGWATHDERIFLSDGVDFAVRVYDATGAMVAVFREEAIAPEVSERDAALLRAEREAQDRPLRDDVPLPDRFGAYDRLLVSHEGALWARWSRRPSEEHVRWTVYSPDGASMRRLVLPDVDVHAVRDGRVYAVTENEVGIETVLVLAEPGR